MLWITNISITAPALLVLRERHARFRPRREGEKFGMYLMSSFVNPDGSTVRGFRPGYSINSVPAEGLADHWAMAQPLDGADFLFMPKFNWRAEDYYVIDLVSPAFELFSIGPEGETQG